MGTEAEYINDAITKGKFSGGGEYTQKCHQLLQNHYNGSRCFLTTSGSHALEMAALLCELAPGDEVIVPSFAFPTTVSSFVRCGAVIKYVDVKPNDLNICPIAVQQAITERTRVIVALHYAGVSCDMDILCQLARQHNLMIVEDAAHAIGASYQSQPVGTQGHLACFSFHESKNIQCGEGGALVCNKPELIERSEILLEKGTDRSRFFRGEIQKYQWQEIGSSFLMSELCAAFLYPQLLDIKNTTDHRLKLCNAYKEQLQDLSEFIDFPDIDAQSQHNGHMFRIMLRDSEQRQCLLDHLRSKNIFATFHYQALHNSPAGNKHGIFVGADNYTTSSSQRLLRLPMYYGLEDVDYICDKFRMFFK